MRSVVGGSVQRKQRMNKAVLLRSPVLLDALARVHDAIANMSSSSDDGNGSGECDDDRERRDWITNCEAIVGVFNLNLLGMATEREGDEGEEAVHRWIEEVKDRAFKTRLESVSMNGGSTVDDRSRSSNRKRIVLYCEVLRFTVEQVCSERFARAFPDCLEKIEIALSKARGGSESDDSSNDKKKSNSDDFKVSTAMMRVVEIVAKRSGALAEHMPGVRHNASQRLGKILQRVLASLMKIVNNNKSGDETLASAAAAANIIEYEVSALNCIEAICISHPSCAKPYASKLRVACKSLVTLKVSSSFKKQEGGNNNNNIFRENNKNTIEAASSCFATIVRASGSTKELAAIWHSTIRSALCDAHKYAKTAFDGFEKLDVAEKGYKMLTPTGYNLPEPFFETSQSEHEQNTVLVDLNVHESHRRLDALLIVCKDLLELKGFPAPVNVPIQPICELVKRILKCTGTPISQSPGLPAGLPSPRLSANLPSTHEKSLCLLSSLIRVTKITFAPLCSFACAILDDCFRSTAANDITGEVTNACVRQAAYKASMDLANSLGATAVKSFICDAVVSHAIEDSTATFTNIVASSSGQKLQKSQQQRQERKKKKHGAHGVATDQDPDVLREIAARVDNEILLAGGSTATTRAMTSTAALKCLATLLRVGGASISGSARRAIDDVVAAAYSANVSEPSNLYRDATYNKILIDLTAAKGEALLASTLAPTSHRSRNSALAFSSFANNCNAQSIDARIALESLMHPSAPPLLERAGNSLKNATREEKAKWLGATGSSFQNKCGEKPTWGGDDDEEEEEEDEEEEIEEIEEKKTAVVMIGEEEEEEEAEEERKNDFEHMRKKKRTSEEKEENEEFGAFGVSIDSKNLRTNDDAWTVTTTVKPQAKPTTVVVQAQVQESKKKKFGKSVVVPGTTKNKNNEADDDSDSDGALPDIVFDDDDDDVEEEEEEEEEENEKPKKKKSKR
jgi:hypothetical protein